MYMAWVERVPNEWRKFRNEFAAWQMVSEVSDECDEETKRKIERAKWNKGFDRKRRTALSSLIVFT